MKGKTMLEDVQIIRENDEARFAVIPYWEFLHLRELLWDVEKLEDYLDYLHMQRVKQQSQEYVTLAEVKEELGLSQAASGQ